MYTIKTKLVFKLGYIFKVLILIPKVITKKITKNIQKRKGNQNGASPKNELKTGKGSNGENKEQKLVRYAENNR